MSGRELIAPFEKPDAPGARALLRELRAAFPGADTNCLMADGALGAYAAEGRLLCARTDEAAVFLADEGAYYQAYYYLRPGGALPALHPDKCAVIAEPDIRGRRAEYIRRMEPAFLAAGFGFECRNIQLELDLTANEDALRAAARESAEALKAGGYTLAAAPDAAQTEQTARLWRAHLKPTDVPLDHYAPGAGGGDVLCAVDGSGDVAAAMWRHHEGRASQWRHIVTHPAHRREGLALALLHAWALDALEHGCAVGWTWADERNTASLRLQQKLGSRPNGRSSTLFILPG